MKSLKGLMCLVLMGASFLASGPASAFIHTPVTGSFTAAFNPDQGQCAVIVARDNARPDEIIPEFDPIGPLCQYSMPPVLPDTSLNGVKGTWEPPVINTSLTGSFAFIFVPDPGQGAVQVSMDITILPEIIPEFDPIGPLCQYSTSPVLPDTSLNGITGTWEPAVITADLPGTYIFTFTPDAGQCAVTLTMEIAVYPLPSVFAGTDRIIPYGTGTTLSDATAAGNTPLTYNWMPAGLLIDPQVLNPTTVNLTNTTTFILTVTDSNGCENSAEVTIAVGGSLIQALAGEGEFCIGDAAIVPIMVDNFQSVKEFQLKLNYDADYLLCEGIAAYINPLLGNISGSIDQGNGVIIVNWQSDVPVTFSQMEEVVDLIFTLKVAGSSQLQWFTGSTQSYFHDSEGNPIPAEFQNGEITIYDPPEIILEESKTVCPGETVTIPGIATSANPPLNYLWTYPDGSLHPEDPYFASITPADAGIYSLLVTDSAGCTNQKSVNLEVSCQDIAENNTSRMVIYPNPGNGLVEVRLSVSEDVMAEVNVYDAAGTLVCQKAEAVFQATGRININLSGFADGVYFMQIKIKDSVFRDKLILSHH